MATSQFLVGTSGAISIETLHKKAQSFSIAERDSNYVFTSLMTPTSNGSTSSQRYGKNN
jgi:hypothetical protein